MSVTTLKSLNESVKGVFFVVVIQLESKIIESVADDEDRDFAVMNCANADERICEYIYIYIYICVFHAVKSSLLNMKIL